MNGSPICEDSSLKIVYIRATYLCFQVLKRATLGSLKQQCFDFLNLFAQLGDLLIKNVLDKLVWQFGTDFVFELAILQDEEKD